MTRARNCKAAHTAPATQHRVIPVEWHRVAVEPQLRLDQSGFWCPRCHVGYASEMALIHHLNTCAAQPANTDDRQAETIPRYRIDSEGALEASDYGMVVTYPDHLFDLRRAETRIEVLEAALRRHDKAALAMDSVTPKDTVKYDGSKLQAATWLALAAPSGEPRKVITQDDIDRIDAGEGPNRAVVKGRSQRFGDSHD